MRKSLVKHLQPGDKLARAVYSSRGALIMPRGLPLVADQIERLANTGITEVFVEDPRVADIDILEPVGEVTKIKALRVLKELFADVRKKEGSGKPLQLDGIREVIKDIIGELHYQKSAYINLMICKPTDNYIHMQALNVAILSITMAKLAGFISNIHEIALGAFLKDIGMAYLSEELINRPGLLTDDEKIALHDHPRLGVELLNEQPGINAFTKIIINQHHERCDGSGYPLGLKDKNLHNLAKLVAIADSYAALVSYRPYREKLSPNEAIELVMSNAGFEFEHNLVNHFTKCTVPYPIGTMVQLTTGETGMVVNLGQSLPTRPIVRIFTDQQGKEVEPCYEINLMDPAHQTKLIAGVLDE